MRVFIRLGLLLSLLWILFAALVPATPPQTRAQTDVPRFEPFECIVYGFFDQNMECGFLIVPEDRTDPGSRTIRLGVAILKSTSSTPAPDPVIYLVGGPGGSALLGYEGWVESPIRRDRDLILLDQRGTGLSDPSLDCPAVNDLVYGFLGYPGPAADAMQIFVEEMLACRDTYREQGVNLTAYNSRENAADVDALRQVLGYESWNLYGISYGTRLALTVMRDHPEGVRSVVLDSTFSPEVELNTRLAEIAARSLGEVFAGCKADAACNAIYPDLETVFYEVVARLNADPVVVEATHPYSGEARDIYLSGDALITTLFYSLYRSSLIPYLPATIYATYEEYYTLAAELAALWIPQGRYIYEGMHYSVMCHEEIAFIDFADVEASAAQFPAFESFALLQVDFDICAEWGAGVSDAIETEPVESDIPTLVMAGEYDPVTPPGFGREVAEHLPNSFFFEYPGVGHGVTRSDPCPLEMMLEFLDNPATEPDAACIATMPPPPFFAQKA